MSLCASVPYVSCACLQFSRFVVEKGSARKEAFGVDPIPPFVPVGGSGGGGGHSRDVMVVERMCYISSIDALAVAVVRSPVVRIFTTS